MFFLFVKDAPTATFFWRTGPTLKTMLRQTIRRYVGLFRHVFLDRVPYFHGGYPDRTLLFSRPILQMACVGAWHFESPFVAMYGVPFLYSSPTFLFSLPVLTVFFLFDGPIPMDNHPQKLHFDDLICQ